MSFLIQSSFGYSLSACLKLQTAQFSFGTVACYVLELAM